MQDSDGLLQARIQVGTAMTSVAIGRVVTEPFQLFLRCAACKALSWMLDICQGACVIDLKKLPVKDVNDAVVSLPPLLSHPGSSLESDLATILQRQSMYIESTTHCTYSLSMSKVHQMRNQRERTRGGGQADQTGFVILR